MTHVVSGCNHEFVMNRVFHRATFVTMGFYFWGMEISVWKLQHIVTFPLGVHMCGGLGMHIPSATYLS